MSHSSNLQTQMQALLLDVEHRTGVVQSILVPTPSSNEVLIKVHAIALNPVDPLYTSYPLGSMGRVLGSDFSGIVVSLGSSVPATSQLEPGTRVAGFLQGASSINDRPGAFAEYAVCPWDLVWRIGDLSFEQAATVSLCALTAAQALFFRLGIEAPFTWKAGQRKHQEESKPLSVFMNGASTSVALYAAQLVQRSPYMVTLLGTASPKHFAMLREAPYCYDHVVDYRSDDWAQQVLELTEGGRGVNFAYGCISEGSTVLRTSQVTENAFKGSASTALARVAVVRSREGSAWNTPVEKLGLEPSYGAVWEGLGEEVLYAGMKLARLLWHSISGYLRVET